MNRNSEDQITCRTLCIGIGNSGKSNFIRRLIDNTFDDMHKPTQAVSYNDKTTPDNRIKFQFWDTNAQTNIMKIILPNFQDAQLIPIFIDSTRITESIEYLRHLTIKIAYTTKLVVIFTKCDNPESEQLTQEQMADYKQQIAEMLNINVNRLSKHYVTSAKTGVGMDAAFKGFIDEALKYTKPAAPFDITWNYVKGRRHENFHLFAKPIAGNSAYGDNNNDGDTKKNTSGECVLS